MQKVMKNCRKLIVLLMDVIDLILNLYTLMIVPKSRQTLYPPRAVPLISGLFYVSCCLTVIRVSSYLVINRSICESLRTTKRSISEARIQKMMVQPSHWSFSEQMKASSLRKITKKIAMRTSAATSDPQTNLLNLATLISISTTFSWLGVRMIRSRSTPSSCYSFMICIGKDYIQNKGRWEQFEAGAFMRYSNILVQCYVILQQGQGYIKGQMVSCWSERHSFRNWQQTLLPLMRLTNYCRSWRLSEFFSCQRVYIFWRLSLQECLIMLISFCNLPVRLRNINGSVYYVFLLFQSCIECRLPIVLPLSSFLKSLERACTSYVRFLKNIYQFLRCRYCTFLYFSYECKADNFFGLLF